MIPSQRLLLFVLLLALNRGSLAIVGGCVPWLSPRSDLRDSSKPRSPRKVTERLHDALPCATCNSANYGGTY